MRTLLDLLAPSDSVSFCFDSGERPRLSRRRGPVHSAARVLPKCLQRPDRSSAWSIRNVRHWAWNGSSSIRFGFDRSGWRAVVALTVPGGLGRLDALGLRRAPCAPPPRALRGFRRGGMANRGRPSLIARASSTDRPVPSRPRRRRAFASHAVGPRPRASRGALRLRLYAGARAAAGAE